MEVSIYICDAKICPIYYSIYRLYQEAKKINYVINE